MYRVGLGKDLHRLVSGRPFILGGIEIPSFKGEEGYSDGDVLIHAVIDALLGASSLGDIGELFPPGDPKWKNADSKELLRISWNMVIKEGWQLVNLDCVVSCENPRILPYRESIRSSLAQNLGVSTDVIFIKGKTAEGLGPIGKGEAVEALALCLLEKEAKD